MHYRPKKPDSHVAYGAAMDGFAALASSVAIVGRYWWNVQMQLLQKLRIMSLFKAHWWLFLVVGFILLAFLPPVGIAFILSAWCAGRMDPRGKDDFIVPLKSDQSEDFLALEKNRNHPNITHRGHDDPTRNREYEVHGLAEIYHISFLQSVNRELNNEELAAAAIGSFDGTVQALGLELTSTDMFIMGSAFALKQLNEFGRVADLEPDIISELTIEAMTSDGLADMRKWAGQLAYTMHETIKE